VRTIRPFKVLHLPTTVGGNPQGLSRHLNQLGLQSETWTLKQNFFGYSADRVISRQTDGLFLREFKRLLALRYVFGTNVVFFNYGQTLFQQLPRLSHVDLSFQVRILHSLYRFYAWTFQSLELFLLRIQKVALFVQYQGDDARQGDYCLANFSISIASQVHPGYYSVDSDALKRKQIQRITNLCFKTYALNPDLLHVLPPGTEFLPYSHISLQEWRPCFTQMESRPLRIGHAPSHRGVKGTEIILNALDTLHQNGLNFELVLVEGLSNDDAKERYKTIDILVDQLFAGWYGGLAVEAMALGKPVIAYIRDEDLIFLPHQMAADLPIIRTTPTTVQSVLEHVLLMPRNDLLELAKSCRAYVERWHDPIAIAQRVKKDIEDALASL
jgi:hypothetical protein